VLIFSISVVAPALTSDPAADEQVASDGSPPQLRLTALASPNPPVTFTGTTAISPAATVILSTLIVNVFEAAASSTTSFNIGDTLAAVSPSPE